MVLTVQRSNHGFSLLEAMIAVFILTVVMLWSLQGLMSVNQMASTNKIREEAIKLGQELLVDDRNIPYVPLPVGTTTQTITRQIASYDVSFTVIRVCTVEVVGISKSVTYTIQWDGGNHSYVARTLVSNK